MAKKLLCALLAVLMLVGVCACAKAPEAEPAVSETEVEEKLDYQFGKDVTFHSDVPVTYSMYFSDASWYPMVDTWESEGVFKKIEELTNVHLDLTSYDSGDYTNKITLEINAGDSKYIIPKVYDESAFVNGGAVVAVSDYTQYMPNYTAFVEQYNLQPDLNTIVRADGKYYRLPGLHSVPNENYSFLIRQDIFEAAGIDVKAQEKNWTWEDLYDDLVKVKAYMVENGLCKEKDYIWSDLWSGSESGQNSGGNLLKMIAHSYGIKAGWELGNSMIFDSSKDQWICGSTTDNYKDFVKFVNKLISEKILDPETFTQDDTTANNKFFNGQTVIHSCNRSQVATWQSSMDEMLGDAPHELYMIVTPTAVNNYASECNRLENGVMISKNALDDLGEDGFIKMMRFVDWLWYSDEAYVLTKWGVEGETFEVKDGIKQLLPGYCCSGLGFSAKDDSDVDIRLQWGYAGGNFWYGGPQEMRDDNLSPAMQDWCARVSKYRDVQPLDPVVVTDEDQDEMLNLWQTAICDTINTWTLNFVTGKKDVDKDWDAYVAELEGAGLSSYLDMYNAAYKASK